MESLGVYLAKQVSTEDVLRGYRKPSHALNG
jgi:hypothetical protein